MSNEVNNPYVPPVNVTKAPRSLPSDTEFLFNDEVIAAVGTLTLPAICVLTGGRQNIDQQTSVLRATPTSTMIQFICIGNVATATSVGLTWRYQSSLGAAAIVILLVWLIAIVVGIKIWKKRPTLELTWFISKTELSRLRSRHEHAKWLFVATACLSVVGWQVAFASETIEAAIMIGILLIARFFLPNVLGSDGCYKGLIVVKGFKPPFLQELRRLVDADAKRTESKSDSDQHSNAKRIANLNGRDSGESTVLD